MRLTDVSAIVFDLDGTLIDSRHDIARAANHALARYGLPTLPVDVIASYVGDGAPKLMERASGLERDSERFVGVLSEFREHYTAHAVIDTRPYPGVRETLDVLCAAPGRRLSLAVCTNKPRLATVAVLDQLDLSRYFTVVVAGDDLPTQKPEPEMLLSVCQRLRVPTTRCAMVGDGPQDIECGRRAGAVTIGVSYGIKSASEMRSAAPDFEVDHFAKLLPLLGWS